MIRGRRRRRRRMGRRLAGWRMVVGWSKVARGSRKIMKRGRRGTMGEGWL